VTDLKPGAANRRAFGPCVPVTEPESQSPAEMYVSFPSKPPLLPPPTLVEGWLAWSSEEYPVSEQFWKTMNNAKADKMIKVSAREREFILMAPPFPILFAVKIPSNLKTKQFPKIWRLTSAGYRFWPPAVSHRDELALSRREAPRVFNARLPAQPVSRRVFLSDLLDFAVLQRPIDQALDARSRQSGL